VKWERRNLRLRGIPYAGAATKNNRCTKIRAGSQLRHRRQRFEVVGCDAGTRYRILRGKIMNIVELAASGRVTRRWCFAPEGALATWDVMLAQKIAPETFELNALAVANHDGRQAARFPSRSFATLVWSFFEAVF
jgi:hypothetical protein